MYPMQICPKRDDRQWYAERQTRIQELSAKYVPMDLFADMKNVTGPETKPLYCQQLNRWFDSGTDAARCLSALLLRDIKRKDIRTAIVRGGRVAGFSFSYDGPEKDRPKSRMKSGKAISRAVTCVETGEMFPSIADMARRLKINRDAIRIASLNDEVEVDGKHYQFAHLGQSAVQ